MRLRSSGDGNVALLSVRGLVPGKAVHGEVIADVLFLHNSYIYIEVYMYRYGIYIYIYTSFCQMG